MRADTSSSHDESELEFSNFLKFSRKKIRIIQKVTKLTKNQNSSLHKENFFQIFEFIINNVFQHLFFVLGH